MPWSANRYQDIAVRAVRVVQARKAPGGSATARLDRTSAHSHSSAAPPPLLEAVAEEIYRAVLFTVFFLQVSAISFVPYIGEAVDLSSGSVLMTGCV